MGGGVGGAGVSPERAGELLRAYPGAVRAAEAGDARRKKAGLAKLDSWWAGGGAREAALAREPPHLEKADLVRLVEWKLARGKFRPLLRYARDLREADVAAATAAAFNPGADFEAAMTPLLALRGIGPATASAVLSVARDEWPFMSDEALNATDGGRTYTLPRLRQLVAQLTQLGCGWGMSAAEVEKVLYALAHEGELSGDAGGGSKPPRKRAPAAGAKARPATRAKRARRADP